MFQSQARSQSTGDQAELFQVQALPEVSISGEKPIHWRLRAGILRFQGNLCFNLRREANPLATSGSNLDCARYILFQSQARSQSTGDFAKLDDMCACVAVSISGEKPIHWRRL